MIRFPLPAQYERCYRELLDYPGLDDDWDGYGGNAPPASAAHEAAIILSHLAGEWWLAAPTPAPTEREVLLYWRTLSAHVEFGFEGDGTYYFYGRTPNNPEPLKLDNLNISEGLDTRIRSLLLKHANDLAGHG